MSAGRCYIGTSGWSYAHWAGGRFYPRGLKPGDWLPFLAERFNTLEINSSFYRPPRPQFIRRWKATTGAGFRFAIKLWRRITHDKKLTDCEQELGDFLNIVSQLGPRRGPLLVQLPPSLHKDVECLAQFVRLLRRRLGRRDWPVAIEFRCPTWLCDEVYTLLSEKGIAVCLADLPRCPVTQPNDAPLVYVRRHGPGGHYRGSYGAAEIAADAASIRQWLAEGRDVYVYYNNDADGYAPENARQLAALVGQNPEVGGTRA